MFREGATTRLSQDMIQTHCGWSPLIGREVAVPADLVFVQGNLVAKEGVLQDDLLPGRHVLYARD